MFTSQLKTFLETNMWKTSNLSILASFIVATLWVDYSSAFVHNVAHRSIIVKNVNFALPSSSQTKSTSNKSNHVQIAPSFHNSQPWNQLRHESSSLLFMAESDEITNNINKNNGDDDFAFSLPTSAALVGGQSSLILISVIIASVLKVPNFGWGESFVLNGAAIQKGILATLPLFAIAFALDVIEEKVPALQNVSKATQRSVLALMGGKRNFGIAFVISCALGLAAGVGEEMLFRGLLQTKLLQLPVFSSFGWVPVTITSLIFGALHAITPLYAIIATIASFYFGYLYLWTAVDSVSQLNLAIPIICHTLYDVGALLWAHYEVTKMSIEEQISLSQWVPPSDESSE